MSIITGHRLYFMTAIEQVRETITQDVFDYTQLMSALLKYRKPRDVVTSLLENDQIVRVRKGLYLFGHRWRKHDIPLELLANLIFGPSQISLDYALAWHGLIPEHVTQVTSVTPGRSRQYDTAFGIYAYKQIPENCFQTGYFIHEASSGNWIMREPLVSLADKVWTDKRFRPTSPKSYEAYLFDDLRIDAETLEQYCKREKIDELRYFYGFRKVNWLTIFLLKNF